MHLLLLLLLLLLLILLFLLLFLLWLGLLLRLWYRLLHLAHHNNEVSLFDTQFFDSVLVTNSLALEHNFEGISRHTLSLLYFGFKSVDLHKRDLTLSAGSTYTWNTSPLRFLIFSFITT
jgi:uncharacterized protein (DUF58 family)